MDVIHDLRKEKVDINKKIYECSICANLFNWTSESHWYGSYADMEKKPEKIIYCCSVKCVEEFNKTLK